MNKLGVGDKIICVEGCPPDLISGNIYTIKKDKDVFWCIAECRKGNEDNVWFKNRFLPVYIVEFKNKLKDIVND